jgi:hypothetical protein
MKYLAFLLLLVGCNSTAIYNKGDCVRVYSSIHVIDLYVREVTKTVYVTSPAFLKPDGLYHTTKKFAYRFGELTEDNSRKIKCTDVE